MPKLGVSDKTSGAVLPPEVYKVEITNVAPKMITFEGKEKEVLEFTFEVRDDPDYEGEAVTAIATLYPTLTPKCKLRTWAEAILNRKLTEGEELDTDTLIGKTCRISTTTEEGKQGGEFTKVKDLLPARQPRNGSKPAGNGEDRY